MSSIGQQIRMIRNLRGLTQRELGLKVGFSESTADNRIRQYEAGRMNPKRDKLHLIADALNVPTEALVDTSDLAGSETATLHYLFELERDQGLEIKKIGKNYVLMFNPTNPHGEDYNQDLSRWYYARKKFFPTEESLDDEDAIRNYEIWTQEFPENVYREEDALSDLIRETHKDAINAAKQSFSIATVSEYIQLFEKMLRTGIHLQISKSRHHSDKGRFLAAQILISHQEILALKSPDAIEAYANFFALIDYLIKQNQDMEILTASYDDITYDEFNIIGSSLATPLITTVAWMIEQFANGTFDDEDIQEEYQSDLRQFDTPFENAIERFGPS